ERIPIGLVRRAASTALVARARAGLYGERPLRALSPARRARWFTREGAGGGPRAAPDVVFLRNVLIYFSDDAIRRVAGMLAKRMPPAGWLFRGASESLMRLAPEVTLDGGGP